MGAMPLHFPHPKVPQIMYSKAVVMLLAKLAPWLGAFVFLASIEATKSEDTWTQLWRIGMSAGLGIFVALVGAIYRNMEKRQTAVENAIAEIRRDFLPRTEYSSRHDDLIKQFDRIYNAVMTRKER